MSAAPVPSFVVHLPRAEARAPVVAALQAALPWPVEVFEASDGRAMSEAERARWTAPGARFDPAYPFALSAGEIGCFLSHRRTWQHIVDEGLPMALTFEDDVEIAPERFLPALALAQEHAAQGGYVQFQSRPLKAPMTMVARAGAVGLYRLPLPPLRAQAQLISLAAARRLLTLTERFDRPVDTFLQMFWETAVHMLCADPCGLRDIGAASGGSTIQKKGRGIGEKLHREWARTRYRRAVGRLARAHAPG